MNASGPAGLSSPPVGASILAVSQSGATTAIASVQARTELVLSVVGCTVPGMAGGSGSHDAMFQRVLGQPVHAASQLRAVLPAGLLPRLDLARLTLV